MNELIIKKPYLVEKNGMARLCSDIVLNQKGATLWFGINVRYADFLVADRTDPFVVALLPMAMHNGYDVRCDGCMSRRLYYQLNGTLVPALAGQDGYYHKIRIRPDGLVSDSTGKSYVGTGFSGGVDCLYTVMAHLNNETVRLTHLATFNTGNIKDNALLAGLYRNAMAFGAELGLTAIYLDTNLGAVLPEYYYGVYPYRNMACALALQGAFGTYLLSSGPRPLQVRIDPRRASDYDLLTTACMSTESMAVYLSGAETTRAGKLEALSGWEPSYRWLHPCTANTGQNRNCGHCRKCIRDMTALYGLGTLERYRPVFPVDDYMRHLPERIGFCLARDTGAAASQAVGILRSRNIEIPDAAYRYADQFRRAMAVLKQEKEAEES